jgi:hypothetical protein
MGRQGPRIACLCRQKLQHNATVGAHPVRDKPTERYIPTLRSRTRCAPTGDRAGRYRSALCGSAPCARQTYGAVHRSVAVAHRVRSHRQAGAAGDAARPRFRSSAIRARCAALGCIPCVPSEVVPQRRTSTGRVFPNTMLRALSGHFLWVTFLLGQQKKSDSSGGSRSKRPPRRRRPGDNATTRNRALDDQSSAAAERRRPAPVRRQ